MKALTDRTFRAVLDQTSLAEEVAVCHLEEFRLWLERCHRRVLETRCSCTSNCFCA